MKTEEQAREYVAARCDYATTPLLTSDEIASCVTESARWLTRANSTAYSVGDRTATGGRLYQCITAGTSGASAPSWPTCISWSGVTDGTVVWLYAGSAYREQYDLNAAIRAAWLLKAAKAAAKVDVSDGDLSLKRSQLHAHCVRMANRYPAIGAG